MKVQDVSGIPGPRSRLGPLSATFSFFNDPIRYLDKLFGRYGKIVGVKTAPMATPPSADYPGTVFLYGPDLIRQVSLDNDGYHRMALSHRLYPTESVSERQQVLTHIMTGLPHQKGDDHRRHRRMLGPAFHKQSVEAYLQSMISTTRDILDTWRDGEIYDINAEMFRLTLQISARALFGSAAAADGENIGYLVEDWIRFVWSISHLFPYDLPGIPYRSWLDLSQEIEQATRRLVTEALITGRAEGSLLSKFIQARDEDGNGLSEDDLVGHSSLLMWGSRDATASAMTWTLFLLAQHPTIYADVVDELAHLLHGDPPNVEQMEQVPLLRRVITESLRILPPFPVIHRVVGEQRQIGGYTVPARAEIGMSVYHTHRIPELYPSPSSFDPARWQTARPDLLEILAFGVGPRMCIGHNFAWQEMIIALAMILQEYRLETIPGTKVDHSVKVALLPKGGLPMRVRKQDRHFVKSAGSVRGNIREIVQLA